MRERRRVKVELGVRIEARAGGGWGRGVKVRVKRWKVRERLLGPRGCDLHQLLKHVLPPHALHQYPREPSHLGEQLIVHMGRTAHLPRTG